MVGDGGVAAGTGIEPDLMTTGGLVVEREPQFL
jgi:hypothetical protein